MNTKVVIGAVAVLAIVLALFLFNKPQAVVSLEAAPDKAEYQRGEEIRIDVRLNNTGKTASCVSDVAGGTMVFESITRDGEQVATRSVPAHYLEALPILLENGLEPLAVGETLEVTLVSENDPGIGARALSTTALEDDTGIVTFYDVAVPGEYAIDLAYAYPGPRSSSGCKSVFKGPSSAVRVSFTVLP